MHGRGHEAVESRAKRKAQSKSKELDQDEVRRLRSASAIPTLLIFSDDMLELPNSRHYPAISPRTRSFRGDPYVSISLSNRP
jgi:hypothetical protein